MERALMQIHNNRARIPHPSGSPVFYPSYFTGHLFHRGFIVDIPIIPNSSNLSAIESALERQIDIVADTGIYPGIIEFFRGRKITLDPVFSPRLGFFTPGKGIEINAGIQFDRPIKPVLLHELLHAFHYLSLPMGFDNPDVLEFYHHAEWWQNRPSNSYAMSNAEEFFAVTASTYLCGVADRQPYTRKNLEAKQPHYCDWLHDLFGV